MPPERWKRTLTGAGAGDDSGSKASSKTMCVSGVLVHTAGALLVRRKGEGASTPGPASSNQAPLHLSPWVTSSGECSGDGGGGRGRLLTNWWRSRLRIVGDLVVGDPVRRPVDLGQVLLLRGYRLQGRPFASI